MPATVAATPTRRPMSVAATVAALDPTWTPPVYAGQERKAAAAPTLPPVARVAEAEILDAIRAGRFAVDLDTGDVTTAGGRRLVPFSNRTDCRRFVRLHFDGRRRGIAVARLVWMAAADQLIPDGWEVHIPDGWEVHHEDEDAGNDRWQNLLCLHPLDHRKKHGQAGADTTDEVPF